METQLAIFVTVETSENGLDRDRIKSWLDTALATQAHEYEHDLSLKLELDELLIFVTSAQVGNRADSVADEFSKAKKRALKTDPCASEYYDATYSAEISQFRRTLMS